MKKAIALLALAGLSVAANANLVLNGDFESFNLPGSNNWTAVTSANIGTYIPNWHFIGPANHNVALTNDGYLTQTSQQVDVSGGSDTIPSGIYQTVSTTMGQVYRLSFQVFTGQALGHTGGVDLNVYDGTPSNLNNGSTSGVGAIALSATNLTGWNATGDPGLRTYTYEFTALSSQTTIAFTMFSRPVSQIDNVNLVQAVPEPLTIALMAAAAGVACRRIRSKRA